MKRFHWKMALAFGLWAGLAAAEVRAQFQYVQPQTNPYNQPAVSPFLNLRRGGNAAVNYFALVQPQLQTQQALQTLGQQQDYLQQQYAASMNAPPAAFISGHPTYFRNYSHYFPQMGGGVGGSPFGGGSGGGSFGGGATFGSVRR
jgi:hypothetical protein